MYTDKNGHHHDLGHHHREQQPTAAAMSGGDTIRKKLSEYLAVSVLGTSGAIGGGGIATQGIAQGRYACGGRFPIEDSKTSSTTSRSTSSLLPKIQLTAEETNLSLPLSEEDAGRIKRALLQAGQSRASTADGSAESRLPWSARPDDDFKVVNGSAWNTQVVAPIVKKVQQELGCEEWKVEFHLSELLLCEEGCYYSEGRESEESGPFGVVIINLPSHVEGGQFMVFDPSFYGERAAPTAATAALAAKEGGGAVTGDFGNHHMVFGSSGTGVTFAAFYSNCEREHFQVTCGYQLSLVYHLTCPSALSQHALLAAADIPPSMSPPRNRGGGSAGGDAYSSNSGLDNPDPDRHKLVPQNPDTVGEAKVTVSKRELRSYSRDSRYFFERCPPSSSLVDDAVKCGAGGTGDVKRLKEEAKAAAVADATRRKRAVFVDVNRWPLPPQPAEPEVVEAIATAIRDWSLDPDNFPPKLAVILSHPYPFGSKRTDGGLELPGGMADLKGRDRAVCNLLHLAREHLTSSAAAAAAAAGVAIPLSDDEGRGGEGGLSHEEAGGAAVGSEGGEDSENGEVEDGDGDGDGNGDGDDDGRSERANNALLNVFLTRVVVSHGEGSKGIYTVGPLLPLIPSGAQSEVTCGTAEDGVGMARMEDDSAFLPTGFLSMDQETQVLRSGGPSCLGDLENTHGALGGPPFFREPSAVEFLGERTPASSILLRAAQDTSEDGHAPIRFYSRAAVVFWPRAHTYAVQLEARSGASILLRRLDTLLSASSPEGAPDMPALDVWAAAATKAAILALARQPHLWLNKESDADVFFGCLRQCFGRHDTLNSATLHALDRVVASAFPSPPLPPPPSPPLSPQSTQLLVLSSASALARASYFDGAMPPAVRLPACELFSRTFSLLDDLDCWRSPVVPTLLSRLLSVHPVAFADTVIARVALFPLPPEREKRVNEGQLEHQGVGGVDVAPSPPSATEIDLGDLVGSRPPFGMVAASDCGSGSEREAWERVLSVVLAKAMPAVARGCLRGSERWYNKMDPAERVNSDGSSTYPSTAGRSACKPLSLMATAIEQMVGRPSAAKLVQGTMGHHLSRIEKERRLARAESYATNPVRVHETERTLEELGALIWNLRDLRQTVASRRGGDDPAVQVAAKLRRGDWNSNPSPKRLKLSKTRATAEAEAAVDGDRNIDGSTSMLAVVECLQLQTLRILEAEASVPLPECRQQFFVKAKLSTCRDKSWRRGLVREDMREMEEDTGGGGMRTRAEEGAPGGDWVGDSYCVTCDEVIKPFLENPYECWTSWVPDGTYDCQVATSPDACEQVGVRVSRAKNGPEEVIVLTKSGGSPEINRELQPMRDAVYLRDRAAELVGRARALAAAGFTWQPKDSVHKRNASAGTCGGGQANDTAKQGKELSMAKHSATVAAHREGYAGQHVDGNGGEEVAMANGDRGNDGAQDGRRAR